MLLWYERPADQSDAVQVKRAGYGEGYYKKYAGWGRLKSGAGWIALSYAKRLMILLYLMEQGCYYSHFWRMV